MTVCRIIFGREALFSFVSSNAARQGLQICRPELRPGPGWPLSSRSLASSNLPIRFPSFHLERKNRPGHNTGVSMAIGTDSGGRAGMGCLFAAFFRVDCPIAITINSLIVYFYFRLWGMLLSSIFCIFLRNSLNCLFIRYLQINIFFTLS